MGRDGRLQLRSRSQHRAGGGVHAERWSGRGANRRAADEHRAQAGRQDVSGTFFTSYAGEGWQGTNLTNEHIAAGLRVAAETLKLWDVNGSLGGPIVRDKVWFFWTGRHQGTRQLVAGLWANNNAGNPARWTYDPDYSRQAKDDGTWKNSSVRFTYQATPRNKIAVWWDEQVNCQSCINSGASGGASATFAATALAPEADGKFYNPIRMGQVSWTSPVTTRLLLEAGFGLGPRAQFGDKERDDTNPNIIRVNEAAGIIPNLTYRGLTWARNWGEMTPIGDPRRTSRVRTA